MMEVLVFDDYECGSASCIRNEWGEKQCSECGYWLLPDGEFYRLRSNCDGRNSRCKYCVKKHTAPQKRLIRAALLEAQGGLCAVCKTDLGKGKTSPHLDHDHQCCPGSVASSCGECARGLLCGPCNLGLGMFTDSSEKLMAAIDYLESYKASRLALSVT